MKKFLFILSALCFINTSIQASTISNGGATVLNEDKNNRDVEICLPLGNKKYEPPSWIDKVISPIDNVTSLTQVPVALFRGPERAFEQATSKSRKETNPCINLRYDNRQNLNANINATGVNMGDSVSIDSINVSVNINSDTG